MIQTEEQQIHEDRVHRLIYEYLSRYWNEDSKDFVSPEDFITNRISPNVWRACLRHVGKQIYADGALKVEDRTFNQYDADKVEEALNLYLDLCDEYQKAPSCYTFEAFTGVTDEILDLWNRGERLTLDTVGNSKKRNFQTILKNARQLALEDKLENGKQNPVGVIAIMNHEFGWNQSVPEIPTNKPKALSSGELPKLPTLKTAEEVASNEQ